ncbi:MAG: DNA-binding response regulator [Sulfuricurvum sp. PD_MW2]|uniref:response regulator transcription factor n=1 Tax=Sulfuricurvum sp. PD_MW2 TaxID=2027917 RepID=UPI000C0657B7|nr:response regulator transcription factor [Sulfuricurvum sp. PD_MW2]PHM16781.1 MAG: DNA-binding response regulator [Sulfuricurvum sp. PD_MW2]
MKPFSVFRNMSVLIVEDDIQSAQHLYESMEKLFFEVSLAHDGEKGLELFYEKKPDLLLVDIMMPKMSGFELIRTIRQHDKDIRIVVVTAHSTKDFLMEAIPLKLEKYLVKPIGFEDFLNLFQTLADELAGQYPQKIKLKSGAEICWFEKSVDYQEVRYNLTKSEFKLIQLLLSQKNHIVSKESIESCLYYGGSMSDSSLKGLINKLRQKIGKTAIESHSGYGYKILTA